MGPYDDFVLNQADKNINDLKVFDCEDLEDNDGEDDLTR